MMRPPSICRRWRAAKAERSHDAFTLIELLMVVAIIAIFAAFITPKVTGLQDAHQLSNAATMLRDHLQLARQLAVTRNAPVIVNLCWTKDAFEQESYNTVLLSKLNEAGNLVATDRPIRFPLGFSIATAEDWSSIGKLNQSKVYIGQKEVDCRQIRFNASGSLALDVSESPWFLTVFDSKRSSKPETNFVVIALDPVTGRVFTYQP